MNLTVSTRITVLGKQKFEIKLQVSVFGNMYFINVFIFVCHFLDCQYFNISFLCS